MEKIVLLFKGWQGIGNKSCSEDNPIGLGVQQTFHVGKAAGNELRFCLSLIGVRNWGALEDI